MADERPYVRSRGRVLTTGAGVEVPLPSAIGAQAPAGSLSVTPAGLEYEIVTASQTGQVMGATGATGDFLSHVIFYPATTGAGTSYVLDNAVEVAKITAGTLADLRPITIPINAFSVSGAWKITTGANMTATAFGDFAA
ncbi:MAG: hypothetical protein V4527_18145 [Pseudomonadota bacterium]